MPALPTTDQPPHQNQPDSIATFAADRDTEKDVEEVTDQLSRRFRAFPRAEIRDQVCRQFDTWDHASIRTFVPVFVERRVRAKLRG